MSDEMFGDYFKDLSDSLKRAELQRENVLKKCEAILALMCQRWEIKF